MTTGGTGIDEFWRGIILKPTTPWGTALDTRGKYIRAQGTSFASPVIAGVIALMKGEDPQRRLSREEIISILKKTASYDGLTLSKKERLQVDRLRAKLEKNLGSIADMTRLPGAKIPQPELSSLKNWADNTCLYNLASCKKAFVWAHQSG